MNDRPAINPYWFAPSILVAVPLIMGPLGAYLRILRPETMYVMVGAALGVAVISAVMLPGIAAFGAAWERPWRRSALRGSIVPLAVVLPTLAFFQLSDSPPLSDISTDPTDPPEFAGDEPPPPEMEDVYAEHLALLAQVQRAAYPEVEPLLHRGSPDAAFAAALDAARRAPGWTVERVEPERGRIEATATTPGFGFIDDVAIRVRPAPGEGARIDMRSRSRLGRNDFGANARRIRGFLDGLRSASPPPP